MVNWNSPTETDSYLDILDWVRERDEHIAKLDYTGDSNVPTSVLRYDTSSNKFQRHAGSNTWNNLAFHTTIDNHIADTALHESFKTGDLKMIAHATVPTGWLLCNGAAVSRITYSALFTTIGTAYGAGDGSTTFNLPNFTLRLPIGASAGTVNLGASAGQWDHVHSSPQHTHTINGHTHGLNSHQHTIQSHAHTINDHAHSVPGHGHSTRNGLSTINIGTSGSHYHNYPAKEGGSNGSGANRAQGASSTSGTNVNYTTATTNSEHTHNNTNFFGTVGAWDGGTNGVNGDITFSTFGSGTLSSNGSGTLTTDAATGSTADSGTLTSNQNGAANTGSANPPVLGVTFIIKT